jgi:hypothetical protein
MALDGHHRPVGIATGLDPLDLGGGQHLVTLSGMAILRQGPSIRRDLRPERPRVPQIKREPLDFGEMRCQEREAAGDGLLDGEIGARTTETTAAWPEHGGDPPAPGAPAMLDDERAGPR